MGRGEGAWRPPSRCACRRPQVITQVLERGERGAGFLQNDNIAWRSKLQGKPTDYRLPRRRRADRARRLRAACEFSAAARRRAVLRMVDECRRGRRSSSRAASIRAAPTSPRPTAARRCRKLKLLTLDYAEYKKDKTKILDQMAGHLRRRVGQLRFAQRVRRE